MTAADVGAIVVGGAAWGTAFVQAFFSRRRDRHTREREAELRKEAERLEESKEDKVRANEQRELLDRYRQEMARMQGLWEACESSKTLQQQQINDLYVQIGRTQSARG